MTQQEIPDAKAYKIIMSKGDPIKIEVDELDKVIQGIKTGQPVIIRQGIFNPSFYVSIIEDSARVKDIRMQNFEIAKTNERNKGISGSRIWPMLKMEPLKNIFENVKLLK